MPFLSGDGAQHTSIRDARPQTEPSKPCRARGNLYVPAASQRKKQQTQPTLQTDEVVAVRWECDGKGWLA